VLLLDEYGFGSYVCVHLVYNDITSERYEFMPFQPRTFRNAFCEARVPRLLRREV
jgi:hypothetical protein